MATIATAEVRIIADTRRFVPDLRRKLRGALTPIGNQLGDDLSRGINQRLTQRLNTVMNQAGNRSAAQFARAFNTALAGSGLSQTIQNQLGGAAVRRSTRQAANSIRDDIGGAANTANRAVRRLVGSIISIGRGVAITPLQNLAQLFSEFTSEMASAAAAGLLVIGILTQLSGILFGLPAALAVVGAGVVTLVTAFSGMGEAFSAARGSAEEFETAIEGLAPAAQGVAREFRALDDDLDRLRLDAQEALFSELAGAITRVADNIGGVLHDGIVQSSEALGELINGFADFAAEEETAATIAATFDALTGIFQALADEIQPFLGGLRTLVDEFLPELASIEGVIDGIGTEFQEWADAVTRGDLLSGISPAQRAFQDALDTLQQLGAITGNIAQAIGSVFDAAERNGSGFLDLIERITQEVADAFAAPQGQDTLAAFLDDLVQITEVVLGVIGTALEQFPKIADPIAEIFQDIGPDIEEFINNLGDGLAALLDGGGGEFLSQLAEALGNLDLERLGEGLGRFLSAIAPIISVLDEILNFAIALIDIIGGVAFAINLLGRVQIDGFVNRIQSAIEFFTEFGPRVKDGFDDAVEAVGEFFTEFGPRVKDGFDDTVTAVGEFFTEFGARVAEGFGDFIHDISEIGAQIGEGFLNIFGPIGQGIADAASAVGTFFTETLPNFVAQGVALVLQLGLDIYNGLLGIAATIVEWATGLLNTVTTAFTGLRENALIALQGLGFDVTASLGGVSATFTNVQVGIAERWNAFWTGLRNFASSQLNLAREVIASILGTIRSVISGFIDGARSLWNSFWSGLSGAVSSGLSAVRSTASSALSGITSAFQSMADRIRSILDSLMGFLSGIASTIQGIASRIAGYVASAVSAASSLSNIDLNPFANGGIVYGPTPALVGEAGPEVIIPLTRPQRAVDLVQQSGLLGLLASQGVLGASAESGGSSGPPVEMHVHSMNSDPEQVARRAVRMIERRLGGRGLERIR